MYFKDKRIHSTMCSALSILNANFVFTNFFLINIGLNFKTARRQILTFKANSSNDNKRGCIFTMQDIWMKNFKKYLLPYIFY